MRLFRQKKDRVLWSDYVLLGVLILISAFLVFLLVDTIKSIVNQTVSTYSQNLIENYLAIIGSVLIYFLISILENKGKLRFSEILRTCIIGYVFLIVFLFNVFNLYQHQFISIIANNLTGMLFAIVGVSIYYNYLKNSESKVKAKAIMVVIFAFAITIALGVVVELVQYLVNLATKATEITLKKVITDILYVSVGSLALNVVFYISLTNSKKIVNKCLIHIE